MYCSNPRHSVILGGFCGDFGGFWGDFVGILLPPAPPEAPIPWLEGLCSPKTQFPLQGAKPPPLSTPSPPLPASLSSHCVPGTGKRDLGIGLTKKGCANFLFDQVQTEAALKSKVLPESTVKIQKPLQFVVWRRLNELEMALTQSLTSHVHICSWTCSPPKQRVWLHNPGTSLFKPDLFR